MYFNEQITVFTDVKELVQIARTKHNQYRDDIIPRLWVTIHYD